MFVYCGNNPVVGSDPTGHFWEWLEDIGEAIEDAAEDVWDGIWEFSGYCCYVFSEVSSYLNSSWFAKFEKWLSKKYLGIAGTRIIPNIDDMDLRRPFSENNYRENLEIYTQRAGTGLEAHHVLPQEFEGEFAQAGINIHSPLYCTWVTHAQHRGIHSGGYNQKWQDFFDSTPNPTIDQILNFADDLADEFGFEVYYNG